MEKNACGLLPPEPPCFVHLGKFGDLMILFPGLKWLYDQNGVKPVVAVTVKPTPVAKPAVKVSAPAAKPVVTKVAVAPAAKPVVVKAQPAKTQPKIIPVTKTVTTLVKVSAGTRIPYKGSYAVVMDGKVVEFDVSPRVDEGVPMTPFRHLVEKRGGSVDWHAQDQTVTASSDGKSIYLQIGTKIARVDNANVEMELAPYLEKGRTIVPLSFLRESLHVNIEYDRATNHVLITSLKD